MLFIVDGFAFPSGSVMMSIFSGAAWPFLYLLWRNVCSVLSWFWICLLGFVVVIVKLYEFFIYFWILISYGQIFFSISMDYLFTVLIVSFEVQKFYIFI